MQLDIKDLHVEAEDKEIIRGINLSIKQGEFHVIMGPNGSGKTTLCKTIMGYPKLKVKSGDIRVDGSSILKLPTDKRAKLGIFLEFQNPIEVEGLGFVNFLNTAKAAMSDTPVQFKEFMEDIKNSVKELHMKEDIVGRSLNYGLSGGEKKKTEILQMQVLKPKLVILDEPDSGLDVDAVKVVANAITEFQKKTNAGIILITHYSRILNYMNPQFVHVLHEGKIEKEGGRELVEDIEKKGYRLSE